uniref:Extracellular protein 37 n=1 Tax=Passalora fulva TaxID=5499 RepID=A0A1P8YXL0_PASFU|nr:extracellular protein 37 [Fulvia fulva]
MNPLTLIAFCLHTVHVYAGPYSTEGLSIRDAGKVIQSRWAHGDLFKRKICCSCVFSCCTKGCPTNDKYDNTIHTFVRKY